MIAASRRVFPLVAITLASLGSIASGAILDFRAAFGSGAPPVGISTANFSSVEAIPASTTVDPIPARAFAGGDFSGQFNVGALNPIASQNAQDGVLVGLTHDAAAGVWFADWMLQVQCDGGNAQINDVAISTTGEIFVGGTFEVDARFDLPPPLPQINLVDPGGGGSPVSFIAIADPRGAWIDAFVVPGMQLRSLALDRTGDIFVTGRPVLARRLDPTGQPIWNMPEPPETLSLNQIAVELDPTAPSLYVLGTFNSDPNPGATDRDAFLVQIDKQNGAETWRRNIASQGEERAGGLGIGPLGNIRASVSSTGRNVLYDGNPLQDLPVVSARHAHLLFVAPDGMLERDRLLGNSLAAGGDMETHDLDIDYAGNAHVSVSYSGPYLFKGVNFAGQEDSAVVAIDALGIPIRFTNTEGPGFALGNAVAAPDRNLQILVGSVRGSAPEFFDNILVPTQPDQRAFFSALEPIVDQESYILTSTQPNTPVAIMAQQINEVGGEIYRVLDFPNEGIRLVSAYLTPEQRNSLDGRFITVRDFDLRQDGSVSPSGWALEALNTAPPVAAYSYIFPETCHQTALYLIDTAIDTSSGFFNTNPNLNIGSSFLVRGVGDPLTSTKFDHGTEMLSMIAGPTYGAAQGTPIDVISYDIYPDGATAKLSSLVEAIALANSDKALNYPYDPGVYCIASSATVPGASTSSLDSVIDYAIGPNVYATVLVSAGNTTGSASSYTPSDQGAKSGVICVGAMDITNTQLVGTRGPTGVDLWAPGDSVAAADVLGLATTVSGTSPATAYAAGTALIYLSGNPVLNPVDLETAVVSTHSQSDTIGKIAHIPTAGVPGAMDFADWTAWYGLVDSTISGNDDGDNWTNEEEYIWGFDPLSFDYQGSLLDLSYAFATSTLTIEFPLSCALYQPSALMTPYHLRDGSSLSVERSSDLKTWTDVTSTLTFVEEGHSGNQTKISFDYVVSTSPCFFRIKVQ